MAWLKNPVKLAVLFIFSAQLIYGLVLAPLFDVENHFPLHRWALFAKASRGFAVPIIYIHKTENNTFDPPMNYYDYFKLRKDIDFLAGRDHLIWWLEKESSAEKRLHKESFEKHFFGGSKVIYSIKLEDIDQIDYRKDRKIKETLQDFGTFHFPSEPGGVNGD